MKHARLNMVLIKCDECPACFYDDKNNCYVCNILLRENYVGCVEVTPEEEIPDVCPIKEGT